MRTALLLIALGFGYQIFSSAVRQRTVMLKRLGLAVGAVMMIISLLGSICLITLGLKHMCSRSGHCPFWNKSHFSKSCPMMERVGGPGSDLLFPPPPGGRDR